MKKFHANIVAAGLSRLARHAERASKLDPNEFISDHSWQGALKSNFELLKIVCETYGLVESSQQVETFNGYFEHEPPLIQHKDWPAPGSEDTELGVLMELEVDHGTTEVYAGVQA